MKLVIGSVSTWDHANIRTWKPLDPEVVAEIVSIDVGAKNEKGTDRFSIKVATPRGLASLDAGNGIIATRPLLVVEKYDYECLWDWLMMTVKSCESDTWNASVEKLRLYFDREYD